MTFRFLLTLEKPTVAALMKCAEKEEIHGRKSTMAVKIITDYLRDKKYLK